VRSFYFVYSKPHCLRVSQKCVVSCTKLQTRCFICPHELRAQVADDNAINHENNSESVISVGEYLNTLCI